MNGKENLFTGPGRVLQVFCSDFGTLSFVTQKAEDVREETVAGFYPIQSGVGPESICIPR